MRAWNVAFAAAALIVVAAGCGKSGHEGVMSDMVSIMEDYANTLSKLKTPADVEKYKGTLEGLVKKLQDCQKRMAELPPPSAEASVKLAEKYQGKILEATQKLNAAMMALSPQVQQALGKLNIGGPGPAPMTPGPPDEEP